MKEQNDTLMDAFLAYHHIGQISQQDVCSQHSKSKADKTTPAPQLHHRFGLQCRQMAWRSAGQGTCCMSEANVHACKGGALVWVAWRTCQNPGSWLSTVSA